MSGAELQALLPLLLLVLGATVLLLAGAWRPASRLWLPYGVALALGAALLAALPPATVAVGGLYAAGPFASFATILFCALAALTLLLSQRYATGHGFAGGEYAALVLFAAAGMALLAGASTLVGLFLGLESLTLALYILIAFDKSGGDGAEAGVKYLLPGATATGLLAFGIALLYVAAGSFDYAAACAPLAAPGPLRGIALLGWGLLLAAVAFKLSLVPFHLWTPDVYQGAPAPVTALLSAGSKGAVAAALITLSAVLPPNFGGAGGALAALVVVTLAVGALAPLRQPNFKRLLAYSSLAHMGYVFAALLAGGAVGRGAALFYLVAYSAASVGAFGVLAALSTDREPQTEDDLRGLGYRRPGHAAVLTLCLLSLAGVPATAGFIAKFGVFRALLAGDRLLLAAAGLAAALVSAYYYLRVVVVMYMAGEGKGDLGHGDGASGAALLVCVLTLLFLGIYPGPLLALIGMLVP